MKGEENLEDIGVLFEPNAFYKGIEDYAPILLRSEVENRRIMNFPYEKYQNIDYYTGAKNKGDTYVSPVYSDSIDPTKKMFAITKPIMANNQFMGVILLDVKEDILLNITQQDPEFPSMFVNLIDGEGLIHSKSDAVNGKTLQEFLPEKAYNAISEKMTAGKPFTLQIVNEKGHLICKACIKKLPFVKDPYCIKCGKEIISEDCAYCDECKSDREFEAGRGLCNYTDEMKHIILKIKYDNEELRDIKEDELYSKVYLVPQDSFIFKSSLYDNVTMFNGNSEGDKERFRDIIEKVNLKKFMELHKDDELNPDEMSGGEKKRVSIARALFNNPEIIILDEPTSDLDPENKGIVNDIIFSLKDKTRLVVTHDWAEEYLKKFDKVVRL